VLAEVEQDVNKGIADFTRGRERPRVITAAPHAPAAADGAVEAASDSPREALHAAAQALARRGFHDEVNVIGLS
jgi:hypothetical protein